MALSEWKKKQLARSYFKQLKAGFITYEQYVEKMKKLRSS